MFLPCLIALFIVLLVIIEKWKPKKFVKLHQQLGNDFMYLPILGNAMTLIRYNKDWVNLLEQLASQTYKTAQKAYSFWLLNKMFVFITDADQASVALKYAIDKKYVHGVTKDLTGNGTLFGPAEYWQRKRRILTYPFTPKHINNFVSVFERRSKVAAELLESRVGTGNFAYFDNFFPTALSSVCETLFGVNVEMQRQPDHPFLKAFIKWTENITTLMFHPWLQIGALSKLLPICAQQKNNVKTMHTFVDNLNHRNKALTDEREKNTEESDTPDKSKPDFKALVELIIENSKNIDKNYTDQELREEAMGLFIAGTDTTALATSFTILLLSQHTDVQDKVYKEIQEVLEDSDKPLQSEDLLKLKYLRAVINETLRLYPPAPIALRHCTEDVVLPSGIVLPEGCNVVVSVMSVHRNPQHWGEDVNDFRPERFISEQTFKPNAFIPFGRSPRNCVGQQYAMLSITTTLVTMLRRYRFTPATNFKYDKDNPLRLSLSLTLKHADAFTVQIEYRNKQNVLIKN